MDTDVVKQHIINVLYVLIKLADRFRLENISTELTSCIHRIDYQENQAIREEILRYHTMEDEE